MPTYEYACRDCDHNFEVVQSFSDDPMTVCPSCGGELRKVFSPAGIIFKGSGYYVNDSRAPAATSTGSGGEAKTGTADGGDSTGGDSATTDSTGSSGGEGAKSGTSQTTGTGGKSAPSGSDS